MKYLPLDELLAELEARLAILEDGGGVPPQNLTFDPNTRTISGLNETDFSYTRTPLPS